MNFTYSEMLLRDARVRMRNAQSDLRRQRRHGQPTWLSETRVKEALDAVWYFQREVAAEHHEKVHRLQQRLALITLHLSVPELHNYGESPWQPA